jgi:hypothetical protein
MKLPTPNSKQLASASADAKTKPRLRLCALLFALISQNSAGELLCTYALVAFSLSRADLSALLFVVAANTGNG